MMDYGGPWDVRDMSASLACLSPRHMLDDQYRRVGADLDVPHGASVFESVDRPGVLVVDVPDSVVTMTVSVLAWAGDQGWDDLALRIAARLRRDTAVARSDQDAAVVEVQGAFGPELHFHVGARREMVFLGFSGPRWVVRVTAVGVDITAADIEIAYQMLASMIVYRGEQAMPPGAALSMARVVDPAHREQITSRESDDEIARRIWQQANMGAVA